MAAPKGNKYAAGNKGQRDYAYYPKPEDLQQVIDDYFEYCKPKGATEYVEFPNILGFIAFSKFACRDSLRDYEKRSKDFSRIIKRLRSRCYAAKAQLAMEGKINPTIFIFDAINNHGMINRRAEDKRDTHLTGHVSLGDALRGDEDE